MLYSVVLIVSCRVVFVLCCVVSVVFYDARVPSVKTALTLLTTLNFNECKRVLQAHSFKP